MNEVIIANLKLQSALQETQLSYNQNIVPNYVQNVKVDPCECSCGAFNDCCFIPPPPNPCCNSAMPINSCCEYKSMTELEKRAIVNRAYQQALPNYNCCGLGGRRYGR